MNDGPVSAQGVPSSGRPGPRVPATERTTRAPREVSSQTLLQGHSTLLIEHQGEVYRLQLTRQGKLILTK